MSITVVSQTIRLALIAFFFTILNISLLEIVSGQAMQSGSYQINSDSINFGGGLSTSTNYTQESTVGEVGSGALSSTNFELYAGYQQMQQASIALSGAVATSLSPPLGGLTGGESDGSTAVSVLTDNIGGYQLTIRAEDSPAMRTGSETIGDYAPSGTAPDISFTTGASDVHFGFTVDGSDVVERYQVNASQCDNGSGSVAPTTCWDGLSTTDRLVASGAANQPIGATTTFYFKVGIGGSTAVLPGTYVATTTVTAVAL